MSVLRCVLYVVTVINAKENNNSISVCLKGCLHNFFTEDCDMLNNPGPITSSCFNAKDHVEKGMIGVSGFDVRKILISIHQLLFSCLYQYQRVRWYQELWQLFQ